MTTAFENGRDPIQDSLESHPDIRWDVVVVGAGPAGCAAAIHLADRGHRTLLLDRKAFPREKVCGDALIPDALRALGRVGLEDEIRRRGHGMSRISFYSASQIEVDVPGDFVTLRRRELDTILAREARRRGSVFCAADVAGLDTDDDGSVRCRIAGSDRVVRSRVALVATGVSTRLLRGHGFAREDHPNAIALRCYVRSRLLLDRLLISFDRAIVPGYAWVFPLGNGEYNVGCGVFSRTVSLEDVNLRVMFRRFCDGFPLVNELMKNATLQTPLRGAPLRCGLYGSGSIGPGNVLAIGETIGATFPFSGEGVGKAMETGELAARVVHEAFESGDLGTLRKFGARVQAELGDKYRSYRAAESWMSRSWLIDFVARRARRSRSLQAAIAGVLNETVEPGPIFSFRGLVRSFLG